jgi:hypothetical protein
MESELYQTTHFKLILNEDEARWLKAMVQNPVYGVTPSEEPKEEKEMRSKFWSALKGVK